MIDQQSPAPLLRKGGLGGTTPNHCCCQGTNLRIPTALLLPEQDTGAPRSCEDGGATAVFLHLEPGGGHGDTADATFFPVSSIEFGAPIARSGYLGSGSSGGWWGKPIQSFAGCARPSSDVTATEVVG